MSGKFGSRHSKPILEVPLGKKHLQARKRAKCGQKYVISPQRGLGRAFSDSAIFSAPPKRQSPRERAQFLASFSLSVKRPWQKTRQESEDKKCELKSRYSRAAQWPVRPLVRPFLLGEGRAGPSKKQFGRCRLLLIGWKMLKNHERRRRRRRLSSKSNTPFHFENELRNRRFHLGRRDAAERRKSHLKEDSFASLRPIDRPIRPFAEYRSKRCVYLNCDTEKLVLRSLISRLGN